MPISNSIKRIKAREKAPPVWAGPCGEGPQGGVTQGLIARWLSCRERFRVLVVEGLRPTEKFNPAMEFGNMWHACEECHASGADPEHLDHWLKMLELYERNLGNKYPLQRLEIAEWAGKCAALFPKYVEHWAAHPDVTARTPLLAEQVFDVPYALPSGRTVRLRGKWDSIWVIKG